MAEDRFSTDVGPDPRSVAYLEAKGIARSWRWTSMWRDEHAFGFTLAGVHRLDVIAAAQQLATKAAREGETYQAFQEQFRARMEALGFAGPQAVTEFEEGPRKVDLTAPWRMKVIYDTNVRNAYAASDWQRIQDTKADFPLLEYAGVDDEVTRASHRRWFKPTPVRLPPDHVFWSIYFPPNDFYCRCYTNQISFHEVAGGGFPQTTDADLTARGFDEDPATWPTWRDPKTGRTASAPIGVSPAFAYNAGISRRAALADLLARRIGAMEPDTARAASADLANFPQFRDLVDGAVATGIARAEAGAATYGHLRAQGVTQAAADAAAGQARDQAGRFDPQAWPIGYAPGELAADGKPAVVVVNASAVGHSANRHPTSPQDWKRVQLLLEGGEAWLDGAGDLVLAGTFGEADAAQLWIAVLKPVAGAWRVKTLYPGSPRRAAALARKSKAALRPAPAGAIRWDGR